MKSITIKPLVESSVKLIIVEIQNESPNYLKHFTPYNWKEDSFIKAVVNKTMDQFNGIFINDLPVGFYMLRGLEAGYTIPSYGVWISEKHKGMGLAGLSLKHAYATCKLNDIKTMMLKVHPNNTIAKNIYEKFGFKFNRNDKTSEDMIYHIDIQ